MEPNLDNLTSTRQTVRVVVWLGLGSFSTWPTGQAVSHDLAWVGVTVYTGKLFPRSPHMLSILRQTFPGRRLAL